MGPAKHASNDVAVIETGGRRVEISHPDKVFFPEIGATKSDLVTYYIAIAGPLLNATANRPALLERFPHGAGGPSFFQKRVPSGVPTWLSTATVATVNGTTSNALVVADIAHVLWAVNLGCLGLHLWPYRVDDPEHADELRIDLDPQPGASFDDVRLVARQLRDLLGELDITSFPKTSGNRGVHVYVRLQPHWDSYAVRGAAVAVARELARRDPKRVTAEWWKEERGPRVFVDFNQNAPHKTVFGAWFVRPRVGGQVSTPITWDELDSVQPDDLTLRTVPELVAHRGDPWADLPSQPQSLQPLLALAEADQARGLLDAPWPPEYPKQPNEPPRVAPSRARQQ